MKGQTMKGQIVNEKIRYAFLDVLKGCDSPVKIQQRTGLSVERCQQIYDIYLLAQLGSPEELEREYGSD